MTQPSPPRPVLRALALLFAAGLALYSGAWMYAVRVEPRAQLGIEYDFDEGAALSRLTKVVAGSAAERAGLRVGDAILEVDGRRLTTVVPIADAITHGRPGNEVRLTLERQGARLEVTARLDPPSPAAGSPVAERVVEELLRLYPLLFLIVAAVVLLQRPDDRNAWLLALVFAAFITAAPAWELQTPPALRRFVLGYKILFDGASAALFLFFFSVFPAPTPLDRRLPRLKWLWLSAGGAVSLPLGLWAGAVGSTGPLAAWARDLPGAVRPALFLYFVGGFGLGLLGLAQNAVRGAPEAKRRSRVIVWGTLAGFLPAFVLFSASAGLRRTPYEFPFWIWAPVVMALWLIPLSFAYAVVRHRVLEIPALLRLSARYLLVQRGSLGLLLTLGIAATLFFASYLGPELGTRSDAAGIGLGAGFGTLLIWSGTHVQRRLRERIDRAFFRSAYDARHVLQDLAEKARAATSRGDLAALLEHHVRSALLPRSLVVYLQGRDGSLVRIRGDVPAGHESLPGILPALAELARRGQPEEVPPPNAPGSDAFASLQALEPDCLVPILGRDGRLTGLLVLGPRLSEEPYSGEDKRLLASVASQAGIALESLQLAEQMGERLEVERRAAHELELAMNVQSRLLPQEPLLLPTLECHGRCVQARAVGGDYFDFLELGPARAGIVLADVSGKGFPAALLMANLQATLRSREADDLMDLPRQLRSVNQLLFRFTETSRYATLFLGIYDDAERCLVYANCGHNPPLVLRSQGHVERLGPTAPVLGLMEEWDCATGEIRLAPGDLLAIYSDGISEAFSDAGEEFGESRLISALESHRQRPLPDLLDATIAVVRAFSGSEQEDDQTLVLARVR